MIAEALDARLDHVAVAVGDLDDALAYWQHDVGGGLVAREVNDGFHIAQVRFGGGGKLELIAPAPEAVDTGFVGGFLERFGSAIHHVTLKVADLGVAVDTIRAGGYEVVDVQNTSPWWREGFLRPSQVGGMVVQVAWTPEDDVTWSHRLGVSPTDPVLGAPRLLGPTLAHPDLSAARTLWGLLGAQIAQGDDRLVCRWPGPLDVVVQRGSQPGPTALRFEGTVPPPPPGFAMPAVEVV
jgi:catechol 2,3-dioxygenase-like lactoylglutathione lyase family enzyme